MLFARLVKERREAVDGGRRTMLVLMRATLLSEKWGSYSMMQKGTIQPFPHQRKLCRARNEWSINNSKYNFKAQPNGRPVRYVHSTSVRYRNVRRL